MRLRCLVSIGLAAPILVAGSKQVFVPPEECKIDFGLGNGGDIYVSSVLHGEVYGCHADTAKGSTDVPNVKKQDTDIHAELLDLVKHDGKLYQVRARVKGTKIDYLLSSEKQHTIIPQTPATDYWVEEIVKSIEFIHGVKWECPGLSHLVPNKALSPSDYLSLLSEFVNDLSAGTVGNFNSTSQQGVSLHLVTGGQWTKDVIKQCLEGPSFIQFKAGTNMPNFVPAKDAKYDFPFMMRKETSTQLFFRHIVALPRKALVNGFAVWEANNKKFMMLKDDGDFGDVAQGDIDALITKGRLNKLVELSVEDAKKEKGVTPTDEYVALATLVINGADNATTKVVIKHLTGEDYEPSYTGEFRKHLKSYLEQSLRRTAIMKYLLLEHDGSSAIDSKYGLEAIRLEIPRDGKKNSLVGLNNHLFELLKEVSGMDTKICGVIPKNMFEGFSYEVMRTCLVKELPDVKAFYEKEIIDTTSALAKILDGPKAANVDHLRVYLDGGNLDNAKKKELIDIVYVIAIIKLLKLDSEEVSEIEKNNDFTTHGISPGMSFWDALKKAEAHKNSTKLTKKLGEYFNLRGKA